MLMDRKSFEENTARKNPKKVIYTEQLTGPGGFNVRPRYRSMEKIECTIHLLILDGVFQLIMNN